MEINLGQSLLISVIVAAVMIGLAILFIKGKTENMIDELIKFTHKGENTSNSLEISKAVGYALLILGILKPVTPLGAYFNIRILCDGYAFLMIIVLIALFVYISVSPKFKK